MRYFTGVVVVASKSSWLESNAEELRHNETAAAKFRAREDEFAQLRRPAH